MAKIRKEQNHGNTRFVVDWYDELGERQRAFYEKKADADAKLAEVLDQGGRRLTPLVDPACTLRDYATRWLAANAAEWKPRTARSYRDTLMLHVLPFPIGRDAVLGNLRVSRVQKAHVKALLATKRGEGRARNSVRIIHATLRALLNEAVEDQLLTVNPAATLGRRARRLAGSTAARQDQIKAFTSAQLETFLAAAKGSPLHPLYLTGARAGLRLGELCALQLGDLRLADRHADIRRSLGQDGTLGTPKSGCGRSVDLSAQLTEALAAIVAGRKEEKLRRGWKEMPPWAFVTATGTPYSQRNVLRDFKAVLTRAKLPTHFSPHSLRHTFASLHLLNGASVYYVQQQLGHSSIKLTVDTYGRWLKMRDTAAADRLDSLPGTNDQTQAVAQAIE
jgi:integrase